MKACDVSGVVHAPDVAITFVISSNEHSSIRGNAHAANRNSFLGDEVVSACILAEIPHPQISSMVARNDFTLVRMDDNIVNWGSMMIITLDRGHAHVPNFDGSVLTASRHPSPICLYRKGSDVSFVALKGHYRVRIVRLDVVEPNGACARTGEILLVVSDDHAIDLSVVVLDGSAAHATESLPEFDHLVVSAAAQHNRHVLTHWMSRSRLE